MIAAYGLLLMQEYKELMEKMEIVEKDKRKIEAVIAELTQKKIEALHKTWTKERSPRFGRSLNSQSRALLHLPSNLIR